MSPPTQPATKSSQQKAVVVFEGVDGAGKTTQVARLRQALQNRGLSVAATGVFSTPYGRDVRTWFMDPERIERASFRTQLFLLGSAMNQVLEEIATCAESVVLLDRFVYTTMAYHGGGLEMGINAVEEVYQPVLRRFRPQLVVVLDLPSEVIVRRKVAMDRIETENRAFFERVRRAYAEIVSTLPYAIQIDAQLPEAN
ncbi:MAG: dTMP kinase, partial [Candidatus Binatia bacterium]